MKITGRYNTIAPYLRVKGASELLSFVQKVFNAEIMLHILRDDNKIKHAELRIGGSSIMLADSTDEPKSCPATLIVCVNNADETYKRAIAEGAKKVNELSDQVYSRTGAVTDPFGITWWITSLI